MFLWLRVIIIFMRSGGCKEYRQQCGLLTGVLRHDWKTSGFTTRIGVPAWKAAMFSTDCT